jgi:diacylglycerol O-acyltransferase
LAHRMFSLDPSARDMRPPWAVGTDGPDQSGARQPATAVPPPNRGIDAVAGIKGAASVARSLTKTYSESLSGLARGERAVPFRAPKSVLNGRINAPRRFATQIYDIERLKTVGKATGGSLNDVFLAICGGALRAYLRERDALPSHSLTANVPVSVRPEGGVNVGNAITFVYAALGTDLDDPVERIQAIRASTQLAKQRLPRAGAPLMDTYTTVLMGPFLAPAMLGIGGFGPPDANLVISNVPGLRESRYLNGSRLDAYYPMSLLFHGQALNITGVSNAGQFCIGYTGCRDTLPHLQRIAVYTGEALEELESVLGIEHNPARPASRSPRRRTTTPKAARESP